jgi:hypothetical protein
VVIGWHAFFPTAVRATARRAGGALSGRPGGIVELEARWQFIGRWSIVGFGGAGTTRTERQNFAATQNVGAGGLGFRYKLASKFGMDAGIDIAHSPGTTALYFVVGNAWFRP